jgi:hypothetical protein
VSTLHEQIKERIDGIENSERIPAAPLDALRAVVERHRPVPCRAKACAGGEHTTCEACGSGRTYEKCPDTVAIAAALGVEIEEII